MWEGYSSKDNTWEPLKHMVNARASTTEVEKRFPDKLKPNRSELQEARGKKAQKATRQAQKKQKLPTAPTAAPATPEQEVPSIRCSARQAGRAVRFAGL